MIRLKELRQEKGLNQKELAIKIETTQRNVSNWENGNSEPDIQMIIKMANFFEVSIDFLLENTDFSAKEENITTLEDALIETIKNLSPNKKRALFVLLKDF